MTNVTSDGFCLVYYLYMENINYFGILFSFITGLFFGFIFGSWGAFEITSGEVISSYILAVTGLVVWRYTVAAEKGNEIKERPLLDLYLGEELGLGEQGIFIKNTGHTIAYNVELSEIHGIKNIHNFFIDNSSKRIGPEEYVGVNIHMRNIKNRNSLSYVSKRDNLMKMMGDVFGNVQKMKDTDEMRSVGAMVLGYESANGNKYYSVYRLYPQYLIFEDKQVLQFISAGKGVCSIKRAQKLCALKKLNI